MSDSSGFGHTDDYYTTHPIFDKKAQTRTKLLNDLLDEIVIIGKDDPWSVVDR